MKHFLISISFLIAFLGSVTIVTPQETQSQTEILKVQVGDGVVDGSFIVPYTNVWQMFQFDADGERTPTNTWTDKVELIEEDGRKLIKRTQIVLDDQGETVQTMLDWVDHKTLAPVKTEKSMTNGGTLQVVFDGLHIQGFMQQSPQGPKMKIDSTTEIPTYNWGIYGTLLVGFPLELGYEAEFPTGSLAPGESGADGTPRMDVTLSWLKLKVIGEESISAGKKGQMDAWIVEVDQGPMNFRFWLSKEAPYIIKLVMTQPGGGGYIWEMI
ncbi:MAG: hypothetical protein O7G85_02500 [Planctomycetota bacterium]|nr:hypothetical protein [Planctomycetota bacterium]